jgi:hypothetical protein
MASTSFSLPGGVAEAMLRLPVDHAALPISLGIKFAQGFDQAQALVAGDQTHALEASLLQVP